MIEIVIKTKGLITTRSSTISITFNNNEDDGNDGYDDDDSNTTFTTSKT